MQKLRPFYRNTAVFFCKKNQNSSLLIFLTTRTHEFVSRPSHVAVVERLRRCGTCACM